MLIIGTRIQAPGLSPDVIPIFPETIMFKYKMDGDVTYKYWENTITSPAYICI